MRIAVLSYHTSPLAPLGGRETGGLNVYVRELSRELAERGHHIDVFTRRSGRDEPETVEFAGPFARLVRIEAGPARRVEKAQLGRYVDAFAEGVAAFAERSGLRYDVVHSHYWLSGVAGERLKARWGVPHIAMFHTLGEIKSRARISEHEPELRIAAERDIARNADRIVVAGRDELQQLVRLYGADAARIALVPCGVNLDLFQPVEKGDARRQLGLGDGDRILLFVGRIEPLKGVDILLGAAAQIESASDCFVIVIGGDSTARNEVAHLRSLAVQLGIAERVMFLGAVDHERLPMFYSAADVCVVPSFYESFGLVALEAMACGTPVVASRVGGLAGTVRDGETGYLIPWRCPEPFAERIELLLGNEELRSAFGRSAREAVERYRWGNVAEAVLAIYREAIDGVRLRRIAAFRN
ncbi:MAG: glycosyltransferase [Chloroflexi bacterium]|nr:glycosyltransferase [Chloroflexota bacterium]